MCFMMVLTFMIFWAPLHFLNIYRFYDESIIFSKYFGDLFFVCHILAVSRSFVNPFIYAWINPKFRDGLKYFLCYCNENRKSTKTLNINNNELFRLHSFYTKNSLFIKRQKLKKKPHYFDFDIRSVKETVPIADDLN